MPYTQGQVEAIKQIKVKSALTLNESARVFKVLMDCVAVSSGTMGTLTGYADYETLDRIHGAFVLYVATLGPRRRWDNWMLAWDAYVAVYPL